MGTTQSKYGGEQAPALTEAMLSSLRIWASDEDGAPHAARVVGYLGEIQDFITKELFMADQELVPQLMGYLSTLLYLREELKPFAAPEGRGKYE